MLADQPGTLHVCDSALVWDVEGEERRVLSLAEVQSVRRVRDSLRARDWVQVSRPAHLHLQRAHFGTHAARAHAGTCSHPVTL